MEQKSGQQMHEIFKEVASFYEHPHQVFGLLEKHSKYFKHKKLEKFLREEKFLFDIRKSKGIPRGEYLLIGYLNNLKSPKKGNQKRMQNQQGMFRDRCYFAKDSKKPNLDELDRRIEEGSCSRAKWGIWLHDDYEPTR